MQTSPGRRRDELLGDTDPAIIDLLSPEEQAEFVRSMQVLVGGERLRDFVCRVAPHEPPPKHLQPIIDVVEYSRIKPIRVCLAMPPGHAKTTMLMRAIAWWLSPNQSPGDLCAYVTYSDSHAREKSRIAKETLQDVGGDLVDSTKDGDGFWLTPQGGGLVARGSRGGLTGKRVPGLLVYDDPYKDAQEARSVAVNSMIIERFKAVAFTRLQGGSIIVLHTRWAMDDLIGYILKNHKWDSINVPAQADAIDADTGTDKLGRKMDEVAWPQKYPYEICSSMCGHDGHLREIRETIGEHLYAAMYQGRPRPEGMAVFHEPSRYRLLADARSESEFSWTNKRGAIIIDPAATARTSADWSVLLVVAMEGYGILTKMWIVDCVRIQVEIPELVRRAAAMQKRYRLMIACEAVAGFKAVPQSLRAMDPTLRVFDINTSGRDKFTRAMPVAAAWNSGRVLVPVDAQCAWVDGYIEECGRFTGSGDKHDDQVDATAHGWNILYRQAPKITESDYGESAM